jgi:hypothetical protein
MAVQLQSRDEQGNEDDQDRLDSRSLDGMQEVKADAEAQVLKGTDQR